MTTLGQLIERQVRELIVLSVVALSKWRATASYCTIDAFDYAAPSSSYLVGSMSNEPSSPAAKDAGSLPVATAATSALDF